MPNLRQIAIVCTCAIGVVALGGRAHAGDVAPDRATMTFALAAATDWATTAHFLVWHAGHEDNPVINWAPNPPTTIAVGAAIDVAGVVAWRRLTRGHPRWTATGLYAAAALRFFLAARNEYRIAQLGRPGPPVPCAVNCVAAFGR